MTERILTAFFLVLVGPSAARAQVSNPSAISVGRPDLPVLLEEWRATRGPSWRLTADAETGTLELLSGGAAAPAFAPRVDADFVDLALVALDQTFAMHGIDPGTLIPDRTMFLPLGQIGSSDKMTVRFREAVDGVLVEGGFVNVLFSASGQLLSIQSTGLPHLSGFGTSPSLTGERALARAVELFRKELGLAPNIARAPELVIDQVRTDAGARLPRLCWQVDVQWQEDGFEPAGRKMWIDARDGSLVRSESSILFFDVNGNVKAMASPGLLPDTSTNPETQQAMKYLKVTSAQGTVFTDASGDFTYPGVNTSLACTFTFQGTFNDVGNAAGSNYSLTTTLPANQANNVLMNPGSTATITSQANVFNVVDKQHDFIKAINPADATADFTHSSVVNLGQTCNAFFDGGGINFYAAGGSCPNTAYSTVISHEDGHWLNQQYLTGNGSDGMGEGNADVWALYVWDTPINGQDFSGPGTFVRTGNNTRAFCGDCCPACWGEVHRDGEPWMGAAWKIRNRLNTTNGNAAGDLIANTIFLTWMEAYNQNAIKSVIETQWLTLDDGDGNINNGTPHLNDIDLGFRDQAFPGITLLPVSFGAVTDVANTTIQAAPQTVVATIYANAAAPLTVANLRYRTNGGSFVDVAMTSLGGSQYSATIPGLLAPTLVEYYLTATDSAAHTATFPAGAPAAVLDYDVGERHVLRFDNFDQSSDMGWTHGTYGDTSSTEDDWQHLYPAGKSGTSGGIVWSDPVGASSAYFIWGNDLGNGTGNTGAYSANVHNWLRSPTINCTGSTATKLRFKRWLTVQGSASDQARVRINGTIVYTNPTSNLVDTSWTNQQIDISSIADNNPSVQVEFELKTNGTTQVGGWNVDDVEVLWVGVPACPTPSNFCLTNPNSADPLGAVMGYAGTSIVPNNNLVLKTTSCPPNKTGLYFYGQGETLVSFGDGSRCVAGPIFRLPALQTDASGNASFDLDLTHLPVGGQISAGQTWGFQLWYRDPSVGTFGYNASDALRVAFCP